MGRIRSSRRLEARFPPRNRKAFRPVFREFVLLCRQLDLFGRELLAVDGTRIKAVNNKDLNFTRASLTELFIRLADALGTSDAAEQTTGGSRVENLKEKIAAVRERRDRYQKMLAELERTGEDQISLTDPDSRTMAAHTHVGRWLQRAGCGRYQAQTDRRAAGQKLGRRYGPLTETAELRRRYSASRRSTL
jgi:hypothetical protein